MLNIQNIHTILRVCTIFLLITITQAAHFDFATIDTPAKLEEFLERNDMGKHRMFESYRKDPW